MNLAMVAMAAPGLLGLVALWFAYKFLSSAAQAIEADYARKFGVICLVTGVVLIASSGGMFYLASHPS